MSVIGGIQTGSIGVSGHVANAVAALFLACGQDVACVSEASTALHRMEVTEAGDLYACVTLPNLILGTAKLAEITAGLALAGEISIIAAMCTGEFAQAHEALGRPKQNAR